MKKTIKTFLLILTVFSVIIGFDNVNAAQNEVITLKTKQNTVVQKPVSAATNFVSPVEVVNNPNKYLNKDITFNAEFVAFTALGLDYKPAFKDSSKNIGVLIRRNDVLDHVIPLSEMNVELEAGDKIRITGKVFSTALGDPWVEAKTFTVTSTKAKK